MADLPVASTEGVHGSRHSTPSSSLTRPAGGTNGISYTPMAETLGAGALGRAGDAHGSHATPAAHGVPGLSGAAFTTPPRPAAVQRASQHLNGSLTSP